MVQGRIKIQGFFYGKATTRRQHNAIKRLINTISRCTKNLIEIEDIIQRYFTNLFTTSSPTNSDIDPILQTIPQTVTHSMNQYLLSPFTPNEVTTTPHQSHLSKAPKTDGLPTFFNQTYWPIIDDDILNG